jgi:hypothetical protein
MASVADALRPTLGETGQIYVTAAAARRFLEAREYKEHEMETARRELTELLLDARQLQNDPRTWRARKRSTKLDISAIVEPDGRLFIVTFITVQAYDPPSRTSGNRQGGRSRAPDAPQGSTASVRGAATARSPRRSGGRGGARSA